MAEQIPTVGMCNLIGDDFTLQDILVYKLSNFLKTHPNLVFPHRHSFFQVLYFTKGSGYHTIDFEKYIAQTGQIYFIAPGQVHTWTFAEGTEGILINFTEAFFSSILINPNYIGDFSFFSGVPGENVGNIPEEIREEITQLLKQIEQEFYQHKEHKSDYLRLKLMELFIVVSRNVVNNKSKIANRHNYLLLKNFQKQIEQNFADKKLPKDYAELLFITPNHLNALCKNTLGKSAGEIIRERVLLETKRLLVNSDLSITQISHQLNFDDPSYFVKFFKKYVGVTPEEFRKTKLLTV